MINFIYFDVGGVVIKDFSATNNWEILEKKSLGIPPDKSAIFNQIWKKNEIQIGIDLDVDSLIPEISSQCDITFPPNFSILDQFIPLFDTNTSLWPLIESLKSSHRIGLLTDMYPQMLDKIKAANLLPSIDWDVIIDSSIEKVRKPNSDIFKLAEKRAGVDSNEILFIDNLQKNIDSAASLGWQTFLYDSADYNQSSHDLAELLNRILLL